MVLGEASTRSGRRLDLAPDLRGRCIEDLQQLPRAVGRVAVDRQRLSPVDLTATVATTTVVAVGCGGPGWLGVLLDSAQAVLALRPGIVDLDIGVVGPHPAGSPEAFEVRAFFPVDGRTVEDPVTGSLNASLAGWLTRTGRATTPYTARQGTALGRAGRVEVTRDDTGTIWTGGGTIACIQGHIQL